MWLDHCSSTTPIQNAYTIIVVASGAMGFYRSMTFRWVRSQV